MTGWPCDYFFHLSITSGAGSRAVSSSGISMAGVHNMTVQCSTWASAWSKSLTMWWHKAPLKLKLKDVSVIKVWVHPASSNRALRSPREVSYTFCSLLPLYHSQGPVCPSFLENKCFMLFRHVVTMVSSLHAIVLQFQES